MTIDTPVGVVVVDDHAMVREGLRAMLSAESGIAVLGEASDGEEAARVVEELHPDVVLMDLRMGELGGIEALEWIKEIRPETAVIILTVHDNPAYLADALRAGADGYLLKNAGVELLREAIFSAVSGGVTIQKAMLRESLGRLRLQQAPVAAGRTLSRREAEVIQLVAAGLGNRKIASRLHLAEVTVKKYLQSAMSKLGANDRAHAAAIASREGLLS